MDNSLRGITVILSVGATAFICLMLFEIRNSLKTIQRDLGRLGRIVEADAASRTARDR